MVTETTTNILIVDDEPRIVRTIARLLKPNHQTFLAYHAEEALNIIRKNRIHVVVSDQRMPNMTGVELLSKIKEISTNTMRILLTGYSDLNAVTQSVNDGEIYRYITKPWNNNELINTIRQAAQISVDLFNTTKASVTASTTEKTNIIVFATHQSLTDDIQGLMGRRSNITTFNSSMAVMEHLEMNGGQILVADISNTTQEDLTAIKVVKATHPQILSVVITDNSDSQYLISLINEGQIYRYLTKPYTLGQLKLYLMSSVRYQSKLQSNPQLLARHKVEQISEKELTNSSKSLISKLKALFMFRF
jgi:serine/threonine-protein kinase